MCRQLVLLLDCMLSLKHVQFDRGHWFGNEVIKESLLWGDLETTLREMQCYFQDYFSIEPGDNEWVSQTDKEKELEPMLQTKLKQLRSRIQVQSKMLIVMREDCEECRDRGWGQWCGHSCSDGTQQLRKPLCYCDEHRTDGYDRAVWAKAWVSFATLESRFLLQSMAHTVTGVDPLRT